MVSELFPELGTHADDLCLLNGMHTDLPAHPQAFLQMHCGISQFPRPSLGAWVLYGLGTENANLPGFVTLSPPTHNGGPANYGNGFLPAANRGLRIGGQPWFGPAGSQGDLQVTNLVNSRYSREEQRSLLNFAQVSNRDLLPTNGDPQAVEGLIESYEMAFRMQTEFPTVLDLSKEPATTQLSYGIGNPRTQRFGRQCLLARRLLEAGVRFVEITAPGWDHHQGLRDALARNCVAVDRPIAGLLADLKSRGLLSDTLVVWGGEFGRTPTAQNGNGRDHNHSGYTIWMAGGGLKGGFTFGKTDDYGFKAVEGRVHIHDWHATILHLLGLDHQRLTFRYAAREMRLTDMKGRVVSEILA